MASRVDHYVLIQKGDEGEWSPGEPLPPLSPSSLRETHRSVLPSPRLCEALFLTRYTEKYGTGTLDMIARCREAGLPEPDFMPRPGEFGVTIWRDRLTEQAMASLELSDRQKKAIGFVNSGGRITNRDYRKLTGTIIRTASRDLEDLVAKGVLAKVGATGRGSHYVLARKPVKKRTNRI